MSNTSPIEKLRSLLGRISNLHRMIRPETGHRFDALAAPDAAADRLLKAAAERESETVAEWKATIQRDTDRLEDAQAALKRLKQRRKADKGAGLTQIDKAIQVKESQVALLKEDLSVKKKELISMEKGTAAWLIDAREVASTEADAVRNSRISRLRFIMRELEQDYESHGGLANMKSGPRQDMAEMVLLITALIVDPDAEDWVPQLTDWLNLPWEVRIDGKRKDDLSWSEDEIPPTRHRIGEILLKSNSERWRLMVKAAVIVIKRISANPSKGGTQTSRSKEPRQAKQFKNDSQSNRPRGKAGRRKKYDPQETVEDVKAYRAWQMENPGLKQAHFDAYRGLGVNGIENAMTRLRTYRSRFKKSKMSTDDFEERINLPKGLMRQILDLTPKLAKGARRNN